jgi:hypothetical protein
MKYASQDYAVGMQGVGDFFTPDTTQRFKLGQVLKAIDTDGDFGSAEFVYGVAAGTINAHNLVTFVEDFSASANPVTANTGASVFVSLAGMTVGQYGWFQKAGACVVKTATSIAVGVAVGISAATAGSADTNGAGRQILGAKVWKASTATETTSALLSLDPQLIRTMIVQDASKFFVGMPLSGTGVGAASVVASIDVTNRVIVGTVDNTAAGTITLTGTYTGYLKLYIDSPFIQGAIT